MERAYKIVNGVLQWLVILLFSVFIIICFMQVIFRYVLNNSITWAEELARYSFIWIAFIASAFAVGRASHMNIDTVYSKFPKNFRRRYLISIEVVVLVFFVFMVCAGSLLVLNTITQESPAMRIPMGYVYCAIPVGFVCMLFYGVVRLVNDLKKTFGAQTETANETRKENI
jgi:TRAP-type C4-dicarboxylate transport system permease small subunit